MKSIRTAVLAVSMLLAGTSAHAAGAFGVELGEHIRTYAPLEELNDEQKEEFIRTQQTKLAKKSRTRTTATK